MFTLLQDIQNQLTVLGCEDMRINGRRLFKEDVPLYGVCASDVKRIGENVVTTVKEFNKRQVFALCETLWESGMIEEGWIACELAYSRRASFVYEDMIIFERWIDKFIANWVLCDALCNHAIAALMEMHPELVSRLRRWTESGNRWKKRAAAVTLIIPARKGLFLEDVLYIADALLSDGDDLVQKGYGWALKAASEVHCEKVYEFVVARKAIMPRTAYHYAIQKIPALRTAAMQE